MTAAKPFKRATRVPVGPVGGVEWMDYAACSGADLELFFPAPGDHGTEAMAICARCPVRAQCRAYALSWATAYGVWGGTSAEERERLRRELKKDGAA